MVMECTSCSSLVVSPKTFGSYKEFIANTTESHLYTPLLQISNNGELELWNASTHFLESHGAVIALISDGASTFFDVLANDILC